MSATLRQSRARYFASAATGTQNARINNVYAGEVANHRNGTRGALYLDEFSFSD